tara:strand:- start:25 stop:237 length:213 start_codon:yes stop_codon:yes gene_type:complete
MVITKTKVKKMFNDAGIQCPIATLNIIDTEVHRRVQSMIYKCKEGNIKRLTPDLYYLATNTWKKNNFEGG